MGVGMMDFGGRGWQMGMGGWYMRREMSMRGSGRMIRLMGLGFILILMEVGMRGSGIWINNMD